MQTIYIRTTIAALPEALRVSINSSILTKATPQKQVDWCNATAKRRNLGAVYELATEAEYWAHRKAVREVIDAAKSADA